MKAAYNSDTSRYKLFGAEDKAAIEDNHLDLFAD
jgi:hypothetical protein